VASHELPDDKPKDDGLSPSVTRVSFSFEDEELRDLGKYFVSFSEIETFVGGPVWLGRFPVCGPDEDLQWCDTVDVGENHGIIIDVEDSTAPGCYDDDWEGYSFHWLTRKVSLNGRYMLVVALP
jgi:hypothetical protein